MFPHVCEISHGKTINLRSIYPHHLQYCARVIFGLCFVMQARPHSVCLIVFVFLGPELCRQLPSDSTSQWTPLLLANGWRLQTPIKDFHLQVYRHAWRTQKCKYPWIFASFAFDILSRLQGARSLGAVLPPLPASPQTPVAINLEVLRHQHLPYRSSLFHGSLRARN